MNYIDPERITWNGVTYSPLPTNSYTMSTSSSGTITADRIAEEINRKLKQIEKEREAEMTGVSFNDLEKDLKEFGIYLSTIRHSSGEYGCEIEGYFNPDKYKIHRGREMCSVPITPKKPLPKKVIFSGPATTILWKDGTKTTVKCSSEDVWDDDVGIAMCYLKKMLGNKGNFNNIFREAAKVADDTDKQVEKAMKEATDALMKAINEKNRRTNK